MQVHTIFDPFIMLTRTSTMNFILNFDRGQARIGEHNRLYRKDILKTNPRVINIYASRGAPPRLSPIKYQMNEDESNSEMQEAKQSQDLFVPVVVLLALAGYATTALLAWIEYNQ
jgi:hypothetical protein